ncbi:hypothetical protein YTPLAS73_13960 [Nitrosarchaeum sp.]|nr:hypothetical protein YTPLAS73_13960 [Nitrosarchaeum sp.]
MASATPIMMQDLYFKKNSPVQTSVTEVECYICGRGLRDGSISAKTLPNGMALFCELHYSLQ